MRRQLGMVALTIALILLPAASWAGINVEPGSRSAKVVLQGKKVTKPSHQSSRHAAPAAPPTRETEAEYKPQCHIDPVFHADKPRYICDFLPEPEDAQPARAQVTPGMVVEAVREIGLPSLDVRIQPGSSTLVNVDTIFYTDPEPFRRSTSLLGFSIDLQADAVSYTWRHGDGTSATTSKPGRPYPAMDVTHRYRQPAQRLQPRVDVTYRVRFRVDGGSWQTLAQTLVATGPTATLEVREAAPVLTKR